MKLSLYNLLLSYLLFSILFFFIFISHAHTNTIEVECKTNDAYRTYVLPLETLAFGECACNYIWQDYDAEIFSCKQELLNNIGNMIIRGKI